MKIPVNWLRWEVNLDDMMIRTDSPSQVRRERKKDLKYDRINNKSLNIRYMIKLLKNDLSEIKERINDNINETEQTAEAEGGPIQNRLGGELEQLEKKKLAYH